MQRTITVLAIVLFSVSLAGCAEQDATLSLTLDNIYGQRLRASQALLSPDGSRIAVVAMGPEGRGIYLVPTDAGSPTTGAFWVEGSDPSWFSDGESILFSRDRDLWVVRVGSSDATRITNDGEDERAARPSPDGQFVAFYSGRDGAQDIWVVPSEGGEPRIVTHDAYAPDDYRWAPAWSPDSRRIAYISNKADYWADDLWTVDLATEEERQLSRSLMASSVPVWSPDGTEIALLGTAKSEYWYEDLAYIYVVDAATGRERTVNMQVYATDWLHNFSLYWSGDGARFYFLYHERGDFNLWSVPVAGGVATRVTNTEGALRSFSTTARGDAFAFVRSTPTRGPDVDYISHLGGNLRRMTNFASEWATKIDPEVISYESYDGMYIQGFLFLPPNHQPGDQRPALVHVHGGGTNSYLHSEGLFEQYLASNGYVVLAVNYRGGSGFGRAFQDLSINDWANGQARDAAAAATFLRTRPYSNGQVGIYGYSYGGITSMAAIARVPDAFDAAVPMAGIYDFADAYETADRVGRIFTKTGHSGSPDERPDTYAVSNTLARLHQVQTPLLVMHGEEDVRAPYRQFELAVAELTRHGKTFESRSYPGEPHGLSAAARIDMYERLEEFFARTLRR
jgi:dipeptidyl aminopeptidase/acylaminoacyl peptidase